MTQPVKRRLLQHVKPQEFATLFPFWQVKREGAKISTAVANWIGAVFFLYLFSKVIFGAWGSSSTEVLGYANADIAAQSIAQLTLDQFGRQAQATQNVVPFAQVALATKTPRPTTIHPTPTLQPSINTYAPGEPTATFWVAGGPYPEQVEAVEFDFPTLGLARYSHYWPPFGGVNCDGDCERMASGLPWEEHVGVAVACPAEFPLFTRFVTNWGEFTCMDRGGAITFLEDGTFWLDFLEEEQRYPFWEVFSVRIVYP